MPTGRYYNVIREGGAILGKHKDKNLAEGEITLPFGTIVEVVDRYSPAYGERFQIESYACPGSTKPEQRRGWLTNYHYIVDGISFSFNFRRLHRGSEFKYSY